MSKPLPDFSLITFLPPGQRVATNPETPEAKLDLINFFDAVISSRKLEIDQFQLEDIFCVDLTIDTKKLEKRLVCVLGEALVYYMAVWPGWRRSNEYYSGQLQAKEWFERFRQYLIFKSNFIIKNATKFSEDVVNIATKDDAVQTDVSEGTDDKKLAPYTLVVGGPPSVLNNVVFMECNGNVLLKQHREKAWRDLGMKELLNWPHISVEVKLPDISLTRTNNHGVQRYISLCGDASSFPEVDNIFHIKKIPGSPEPQPYSYNFIECYLKQLLKTLRKLPEILDIRVSELQAIFTEFLADIKEISVYNTTMCPNISIGFHIGRGRFIRNKKMVSTSLDKKEREENAINFYELIIPQIDLVLHTFKPVQDHTDKNDVSFMSLNRILNKLATDSSQQEIENLKFLINNTCVVYNCTLCLKNFSGPHAQFNLTKHFSQIHKSEQTVLCPKCRKQLNVQNLAYLRWCHTCFKT